MGPLVVGRVRRRRAGLCCLLWLRAIIRTKWGRNIDKKRTKHQQQIDKESTQNRANIDRTSTKNRHKFLEVELWNIIVLWMTVHDRLQIIIFSFTINGTFNKWDDTVSGTTCGWTSPEAQSELVLLPVNTRENMDKIRTIYEHNLRRKYRQEISTGNRRRINTKPSKHRQKIKRKPTEVSRGRVVKYYSTMNDCTCSVTNYYIQSWYNKWDVQ